MKSEKCLVCSKFFFTNKGKVCQVCVKQAKRESAGKEAEAEVLKKFQEIFGKDTFNIINNLSSGL